MFAHFLLLMKYTSDDAVSSGFMMYTSDDAVSGDFMMYTSDDAVSGDFMMLVLLLLLLFSQLLPPLRAQMAMAESNEGDCCSHQTNTNLSHPESTEIRVYYEQQETKNNLKCGSFGDLFFLFPVTINLRTMQMLLNKLKK